MVVGQLRAASQFTYINVSGDLKTGKIKGSLQASFAQGFSSQIMAIQMLIPELSVV